MRDIVSPLDGIRSPFGARRGYSPLSLFASGEQGVWYDPSDFSTMFQDSAGTTPVTAVEQPVGLIRDKSGRGNHASQSTSASRPVLQQDGNGKYYLLFDGTDDSLATSSIDFSATDKMSVFAGVRKLSDATTFAIISEMSAAWSSNNGTFILCHTGGSANTIYGGSRGAGPAGASATPTGFSPPLSFVTTLAASISTDEFVMRSNGTQVATSSADQGTGNYGNYPLYIGRRAGASLPANMRLYSLLVRGAQSTNAQIASAEAWVNSKTRAY